MLTGLLLVSQAQSRRELTDGFALRATIGARFAATYVQDLIARERRLATRHLGDTTVTAQRFRAMTVDEGYEAAVLLDDRGRVLHVAPPNPAVLGEDITPRYAHLRAAVGGRARVSEVVPSAARGVPIVAFAVPYRSRAGRRVYSGAQEVAFTPLGAYLRNAIPIAHNRVYVIDRDGTIIVESGPGPAVTTLEIEDPRLARALRSHEEGSHSSTTGDRRFVSRPIAGTPWRLVSTVPEAELYGSISGPSRWAPWVVVVAFALLGLIAAFLLARVLSSRVRLTLLNAELELTARVDVLTGLPNRRHIEEALTGHISATRRHGTPLSVLLIDIDHFKAVNDTHGHLAGDQVLRTVAHSLRNSLRLEDLLGRWGGEEFLAVLPATQEQAAVTAGERLRAALARAPIAIAEGPVIQMTVTIGVAAWSDDTLDGLVERADVALYLGKGRGRDVVELAASSA